MKYGIIALQTTFTTLAIFASGCGGKDIRSEEAKKTIIENTLGGAPLPSWTRDGKVGWEDGQDHVFKSQYTQRGDQRINACFDFAKMELKENLITEISSEVKGEINAALEGTSENTAPLLTKSFHQELDANIKGLKIREQLFERSTINGNERVECFVMASIPHAEYQNLKSSLFQKYTKSSPEIAKALRDRQVQFFSSESKRLPAQENAGNLDE